MPAMEYDLDTFTQRSCFYVYWFWDILDANNDGATLQNLGKVEKLSGDKMWLATLNDAASECTEFMVRSCENAAFLYFTLAISLMSSSNANKLQKRFEYDSNSMVKSRKTLSIYVKCWMQQFDVFHLKWPKCGTSSLFNQGISVPSKSRRWNLNDLSFVSALYCAVKKKHRNLKMGTVINGG